MGKKKIVPVEKNYEESDHYLEWVKGDLCSIRGEAGVFTFLSVRVRDGVPVWLNVWGGPAKCEMMRTFALDRIEPFTKIRRRGKRKK